MRKIRAIKKYTEYSTRLFSYKRYVYEYKYRETKNANGTKLYEACCRLRNTQKIKKGILHFPTHCIEPVTMGPYFHKERKCVFSHIKKKVNIYKK